MSSHEGAPGEHEDVHEHALRALRHRDLSASQLRARILERGASEGVCDDVLAALARTGLVDDSRYAEQRSRTLAGRGAGDARIRYELEDAGIDAELVDRVLDTLEPELDRALRIVERRGASAKTARYLASKGFSEDVLVRAVAGSRADALG